MPKAADPHKANGGVDTAAFEIVLLKQAFGALLPVAPHLGGVSKLQGRADLDTLVGHLIGLGL